MKKVIYFIIIIAIGCSEDEQPIPLTQPQLLWNLVLSSDAYVGSMKPVVYNDIIVYSKNHTGELHKNEIVAYNKNTGDTEWVWKDFFTSNEGAPNSGREWYVYDNIFVFSSRMGVYAIDLDTGQTLWKNKYEEVGESNIRGYGNQVYHVQQPLDCSYQYLIKASVYDGKWEKVYQIKKEGNLRPDIQLPNMYINQGGDTILAFVHSTYDNTIPESKVFMAFYNASKNILISDKEYVNLVGEAYIHNGKIYLGGQELFCFDLETTELLWRTPLPDNSGVGDFLVAENKLFARSGGLDAQIYALNLSDATVIWNTPATTNTAGNLNYHNGMLYYSDATLQGIKADTGNLLWEMESPDYASNSGAFFGRGITIDKATNRLYISNYINALCYQLPE